MRQEEQGRARQRRAAAVSAVKPAGSATLAHRSAARGAAAQRCVRLGGQGCSCQKVRDLRDDSVHEQRSISERLNGSGGPPPNQLETGPGLLSPHARWHLSGEQGGRCAVRGIVERIDKQHGRQFGAPHHVCFQRHGDGNPDDLLWCPGCDGVALMVGDGDHAVD